MNKTSLILTLILVIPHAQAHSFSDYLFNNKYIVGGIIGGFAAGYLISRYMTPTKNLGQINLQDYQTLKNIINSDNPVQLTMYSNSILSKDQLQALKNLGFCHLTCNTLKKEQYLCEIYNQAGFKS